MPAKLAVEIVRSVSTAQEILPENPQRQYALIVNDGATDIYLSLGGTAAVNKGIRVNALGGSYEINNTNLWKGQITAFSSVACNCLIVEW